MCNLDSAISIQYKYEYKIMKLSFKLKFNRFGVNDLVLVFQKFVRVQHNIDNKQKFIIKKNIKIYKKFMKSFQL